MKPARTSSSAPELTVDGWVTRIGGRLAGAFLEAGRLGAPCPHRVIELDDEVDRVRVELNVLRKAVPA